MRRLPWMAALLLGLLAGCGGSSGGGGSAEDAITLTVNAGTNRTVALGSSVLLTADINVAPEDSPVSIAWSGTGVSFDDATEATVRATSSTAGTFEVTVTVTADDDPNVVATDSVQLTFTESAVEEVTVEAGDAVSGPLGFDLALSATVLGTDATYTSEWSGVGLEFADATALSTTVQASALDTYTATITVTTSDGQTATATVEVTFVENQAPVVSAGADQVGGTADELTLAATVSDDGPEDALTVAWTGPEGLTFGDATALSTTVSAASPGQFVVVVTVSDGLLSAEDSVLVTFTDGNLPPVVEAGEYDAVLSDAAITLAATVEDPDGDEVTVEWSGEGLTFADATALDTTVTAEAAGSYVATLTASDGEFLGTDNVTLTFQSEDDLTLVIGSDVRATVGTPAALSVGITYLGEDEVGVLWESVEAPTGATVTLTDETSARATVTCDTAGDYTFGVTVSVGALAQTGQVTLSVVEAPSGGLNLALVSLMTEDTELRAFLQSRGHTVTVFAPTVAPATAAAGQDAVLLSSDMESLDLQDGWGDLAVPLVVWESYALDQIGISAPVVEGSAHDFTGSGSIVFESGASGQATAGLSGQVKVSSGVSVLGGTPAGDVAILARHVGATTTAGDVVLFTYEAGALMYDRVAPARRLGLPLGLTLGAALTADGRDIVEAGLAWVVGQDWAQRTRVMPIGDEITLGASGSDSYRSDLAADLEADGCVFDLVGSQVNGADGLPSVVFDWDHQGLAAATAASALAALPAALVGNVPDVALIDLGNNDLADGTAVSTIVSGLEDIVDTLRGVNSNVTVLLAQTAPVYGGGSAGVSTLNTDIASLASSLSTAASPVEVVDLATGFDAATMTDAVMVVNSTGEAFLADVWGAALTSHLTCSP